MDPKTLKTLQIKSTIHTFELVYETPKAYKVLDNCLTCDEEIWLPKSQCHLVSIDDGLITIEIPDWLARKRGIQT